MACSLHMCIDRAFRSTASGCDCLYLVYVWLPTFWLHLTTHSSSRKCGGVGYSLNKMIHSTPFSSWLFNMPTKDLCLVVCRPRKPHRAPKEPSARYAQGLDRSLSQFGTMTATFRRKICVSAIRLIDAILSHPQYWQALLQARVMGLQTWYYRT